ncbi:ABC transporter permease [Collibacillus ludicampi]|jgi:multiple sugar transport system permease protein|uniref:ABC transporter permease n=1 Tax=Collibacillus ludicampi TaxID=2771369 RepID=A0AAV4LFK6_9BACL|nr:sugar ABC transporter permease [Collibacillus ludicampi]GIM46582.1 ABC transporter permease [Collibacillus ludicampi]
MGTMTKIHTEPIPERIQKRKRFSGENVTGWFLVLPAILYLLVWNVYPLIYALYVSLTNLNLTRPALNKFIGLNNYLLLLKDETFRTAIGNTLYMTVLSILFELVIGYFCAKLFVRAEKIKGVNILRTIFILPIMITPLVAGLLWSYILNPTLGIINYIFKILHLPILPWLGDEKLAYYSIVAINVWQWTPFMMLLIIAGLNSIPKSLIEVAELEGAGWWKKFIHLEIPFISNIISIGVFIRVMENLKMFDVVYATTNGGPGKATEMASLLAYRQSFLYYQTGYGAAVAVLILILSTILVQLLFKSMWRRDVV